MGSLRQLDAIDTDSSKTLDRIDHCVLLAIVKQSGFNPDAFSFFRLYLVGWQQFSFYNVYNSSHYMASLKVPHLGFLLVLLFINDLNVTLKYDDCSLLII
ncbi:hypothetical protein ILUMI_13969 [Ignelater luminosus]|uniref:Uncharacterized protein n=1 Tax=Ignelater luminosus TaxID=2038154 RepID=A0A8K0CRD2_IGNLU|nr:hypothetical protein ILUMI_13969 [Ignelater luminosus]